MIQLKKSDLLQDIIRVKSKIKLKPLHSINEIKLLPIIVKLSSLIFSLIVCKNTQVGGPQLLGDIYLNKIK
jgi:hypothetical protein